MCPPRPTAVSYTHLDVYKRQTGSSVSCRPAVSVRWMTLPESISVPSTKSRVVPGICLLYTSVVTPEYAQNMGAFYAKDARASVAIAKKVSR